MGISAILCSRTARHSASPRHHQPLLSLHVPISNTPRQHHLLLRSQQRVASYLTQVLSYSITNSIRTHDLIVSIPIHILVICTYVLILTIVHRQAIPAGISTVRAPTTRS